ncbi:MAG: PAS domain S-box protein [Spirochaetota bacterium]|nr:PAS domain S-box protein [Spirochaetota bacterium]
MTIFSIKNILISGFVLLVHLILTHTNPLFPINKLILDDKIKDYPLGQYLELLEDKNNKWTFQDITSQEIAKQFRPGNKDSYNFGYTPSIVWVKLRLKNASNTKKNWVILENYTFKYLELYYTNSQNVLHIKKAGYKIPHHQWEIKHRTPCFKLSTEANEDKIVYLRFASPESSLSINLSLLSEDSFFSKSKSDYYGYGFYYGLLFVMIFYNFFLFVSIKDKIYLFYILYIILFLLFRLSLDGLAFEYLWPDATNWYIRFIALFSGLANLAAYMFAITFLNTKQNTPRLHYFLIAIMLIEFMRLFYSAFGTNFYIISILTNSFGLILSALLVTIGILIWKIGLKAARFYIIAWFIFILGIIASVFKYLGILPSNFFTIYGMHIGSAIEVVLFSFALADRINIMKKEKELAQAATFNSIQEKNKLKDEFLQILEHKVEERTNELYQANKTLQSQIDERIHTENLLYNRINLEKLITSLSTNFINISLDEIENEINYALKTTGEFTNIDRACMFLFYRQGTMMDNTNEWCIDGISPKINVLKNLPTNKFPWWMNKLNQFETIYIHRVSDLPPEASAENEILQSIGVKSAIVVPMIYGKKLIGFLGLDSIREEKTWKEEDILLLKLLSEVISNALKRKEIDTNFQKLSLAVEYSPASVVITNSLGVIEYVNPKFTDITGYSSSEAIGKTPRIMKSGKHPKEYYKDLWDTIKSGKVWQGDFYNKKKDGNLFWEQASIAPIKNNDGKITHFVAIKEDITRRKAAEEALKDSEIKFRSVTQTAREAIISADNKGNIISWNKGAQTIFGYTEEEILGKSLTILMPKHYRKAHQDKLDIASRTGKSNLTDKAIELEGIRKDGSKFHLEISRTCWKSADNIFYSGIIRDITERKRVERLREDTERIVKHDIKTPLNSIIGFCELMMKSSNTQDQEFLTHIYNSGYEMLHMIDHSLDLFKMEEGTYKLNLEAINLIELFEQLNNEFNYFKKRKSINIMYSINGKEINSNESYYILGEKIHLKSLFANLILNALEASPEENQITVIVTEENDFYFIDIHNFGVIPEEIRDRLFERYVTSGKVKGTGLGTYSSLLIAKTHGGNITFTTSKENGTHMIVSIPKKIINFENQ